MTDFEPDGFVPRTGLANGHVMTIYAWARPRRFPRLPTPESRVFTVAADAQVVGLCHWQPHRRRAPTLLLLHGLEGSAEAHYMRGMAEKAFARDLNVVRLNQRNCGGTEHLSVGVYHSGLTTDPDAVIRALVAAEGLPAVVVAGYSLGGNLALKLAGEYGTTGPPQVKAFAAVSPTLDLPACIDALEHPANRLYQWNFLLSLRRRIRRKARVHPTVYSAASTRGVWSVRAFDDAITAPLSGYRNAADYYERASALRVIDRVARPTLIITAEDDPFVPVRSFSTRSLVGNPAIRTLITRHGGHCGFVAARTHSDGDDGYWAERVVATFAVCQGGGRVG